MPLAQSVPKFSAVFCQTPKSFPCLFHSLLPEISNLAAEVDPSNRSPGLCALATTMPASEMLKSLFGPVFFDSN